MGTPKPQRRQDSGDESFQTQPHRYESERVMIDQEQRADIFPESEQKVQQHNEAQ